MASKGFISLVGKMRQAQRQQRAGECDIKLVISLENRVDEVLAMSQPANLFAERDEPEVADDSIGKMQGLIKKHGWEEGRRLWREGE